MLSRRSSKREIMRNCANNTIPRIYSLLLSAIHHLKSIHCRIDSTHPLHADFSCTQCYPINSSIRQKIIAYRSRKQATGYNFKDLLKPTEIESPLTEEELMHAYQSELCPHQSIAMARATSEIAYKGEASNLESRLIGSIIRWILSNDTCILKSDIAIVPTKFLDVCSSYDLEFIEDRTSTVEKLYSLQEQNPGRLLLILPRRLEPQDWACAKSVIVYLACKNWEIFMVQAPPKLSSSRFHFNQTDERLCYFSEDLDGIDADIRSRIHIASHANNVYRGFWPISLAAAHNPHVIFQWFGATPKHENRSDSGIILHRSPGV